jgi:hypothetical protein
MTLSLNQAGRNTAYTFRPKFSTVARPSRFQVGSPMVSDLTRARVATSSEELQISQRFRSSGKVLLIEILETS